MEKKGDKTEKYESGMKGLYRAPGGATWRSRGALIFSPFASSTRVTRRSDVGYTGGGIGQTSSPQHRLPLAVEQLADVES